MPFSTRTSLVPRPFIEKRTSYIHAIPILGVGLMRGIIAQVLVTVRGAINPGPGASIGKPTNPCQSKLCIRHQSRDVRVLMLIFNGCQRCILILLGALCICLIPRQLTINYEVAFLEFGPPLPAGAGAVSYAPVAAEPARPHQERRADVRQYDAQCGQFRDEGQDPFGSEPVGI